MAATILGLPEEAVRVIVAHLNVPSLKALSLVNRFLCSISTPVLFAEIQLSEHSAEELDDFCAHLLCVDQRLASHHFKRIGCLLREPSTADDEDDGAVGDFEEVTAACLKVLHAVKSVKTLAIDVWLARHSFENLYETSLLPKLRDLGDLARSKTGKVAVYINMMDDCDCGECDNNIRYKRAVEILATLPPPLLSSIRFDEGEPCSSVATNEEMANLINSPFLEHLELMGCQASNLKWKPPALRSLSISWIDDVHSPDFHGIYGMMQASAGTLQRLAMYQLYDLKDLRFPRYALDVPLSLSKLETLGLAYMPSQSDTVLDFFVSSAITPSLRSITLNMNDVISPDLSFLPRKIPSLADLRLWEEGLLPHTDSSSSSLTCSGFTATQKACTECGVALRVTYSSEESETLDDLRCQTERIQVLGEHIELLSLSTSLQALSDLPCKTYLKLPNLLHLTFIVTDASDCDNIESDRFLPKASATKDYLLALWAPHLSTLSATFSGQNKFGLVKETLDIIHEGHFPLLRVVSYDVLSSLEELGKSANTACLSFSEEKSSIRFAEFASEPSDGDRNNEEKQADNDMRSIRKESNDLSLQTYIIGRQGEPIS